MNFNVDRFIGIICAVALVIMLLLDLHDRFYPGASYEDQRPVVRRIVT